jgi:Dinitrogenase reductase ADP-ribosyltransferase (DRAT)
MRKQLNAKDVANAWINHNVNKGITSEDRLTASSWIKVNTQLKGETLAKALELIYAGGWAFGKDDAISAINDTGFDWDTWSAGNEAAAALVDAPRGLTNLLYNKGIVLNGIDETTMDRIGSALALSLDQGLSADETADAIDYIIDDPARSMVIARTETSRALVDSNLTEYRDAGIESVQWLVADPCDICEQNSDMIMPMGEEFPSGDVQPPAHPNCVCDLAPVSRFDYDPDTIQVDEAEDDIELADKADLNKYDPEQPRDEGGRFASTAGETEGGEAGRVLARDALENEVKKVSEERADSKAREVSAIIKNYVASSIGSKMVGDVPQPELAMNPYANVNDTTKEWDENGINNDSIALLYNENEMTTTAMSQEDIEPFLGSTGYIVADDAEGKESLLAYATASGMLGNWATSSNDNNANSLAVQAVAESNFGISGAADWENAETATEDQVIDIVNQYEDLIASSLDTQYNTTQEWFIGQGISEVTLYRGMEIDTPAGTQEVQMRPLSSWSLDPDQASAFGQTIFQATFPVDRILSIPTTGVGCLRESEVVVLGGRITAEVTIDDVMGFDPAEEMP